MARLTMSDLRTDLRDLIDQPQSAGATTDTILLRLLNRAQRELAQEVDNVIKGYYLTSETITTTAGTTTYDIASDYRATIRLEDENGNNVEPDNSDNFVYTTNTTQEIASYYDVMGRTLWLYPTPSTTGKTYTHYYLKDPTDMAATTSYPDFPNGFERLLVLKAGMWHGISQGASQGVMDIKGEYNDLLQRFRRFDWQRYQPKRVKVGKWFFGSRWPNTNGVR